MTTALIIVIFLPALAALAIVALGGSAASLRGARIANGFAAVGAIVLAIGATIGTPISVAANVEGAIVAGFEIDRLSAVLLPFVLGVGFVVQIFATRYLRGDAAQPRFFASASLLATATAAMVTASTLIGLAAAWTIGSVAVWALLSLYAPLPAARLGVRRTMTAFALGDAALWTAVAIVVAIHGNITLEELATLEMPAGTVAVIAALLLVAALARSAQLPFHRWLPATLAAPTPVSALLHAGVVNAGGILLVRTSPLFTASDIVMHVAVAIGAATAVYGTVLMLTKSDVKGALTHSTMGQMGFMIMTCGLGAFSVAIFHIVAHGMYKAGLFAGAGGAVNTRIAHQNAPHTEPHGAARSVAHAIIAWGGSLAIFLVATPALYPEASTSSTALLIFGWFSAAVATSALLRSSQTAFGMFLAVLTGILAIVGYLAALSAFGAFVAPAVAVDASSATAGWFVGGFVLVLVAAEAVRRSPTYGRFGRLHRQLYTLALAAGHVPTVSSSPAVRAVRSRPRIAPATAVPSPAHQ